MAHRVVYERPYDAEIEYLESTGTQWIDTGFFGNENTAMECEVLITDTSAEYVIAGSRTSAGYNNISFLCAKNGSNYGFFVDFVSSVNNRFFIQYSRTNGYVILYASKTDMKLTDVTSGNTYTKSNLVTGTIATPLTIKIGKTANGFNINHKNLSGRIKYFKLYNSNTLILNLLPVRVGQIGYMYDKVSGKLFANKGTDNFILGNDVANPVPNIRRVFKFGNKRFVMPMPYDSKIEYLESSGTQYIDTGIYGSNNSKLELDLQILELDASKAVFGCYSTNNSSLYLYQSGGNNFGKWQLGFGYNTNVGTTDTNRHTFVFDNFDIKIDGTIIFSHTPRNFTTPQSLLIFNMHNNAGDIYSSTRMRVFSCKLYNDNTLVHDFIPVRRSNVGYMYDKVSGKLFGNAGTGQFILGNDIND